MWQHVLVKQKSSLKMGFKADSGFAFIKEFWVRKFDGQFSICAEITCDKMDSIGAKEITSFTIELQIMLRYLK